MIRKTRVLTAVALTFAMFAGTTIAKAVEPDSMPSEVLTLAREWARINYQVKDEAAQEKEFATLAAQAETLANRYPDRAEPLIWEGVIASSQARLAGAFSALGFAKHARDFLVKAGRIDFRALGGAVPTSLGALYHKVPGFPLGFGDDAKARDYLEQAVAISRDGLDANYFYGDFLIEQGQYEKAAAVLRTALAAPTDHSRPIWDAGRRAEIRTLLAVVDGKLAANR
ncbi:MAG: tetratricopeptide repeat protein [Rhodospirillales bacterium]